MFLKPVSKRTPFRNPFECYTDCVQNKKNNSTYRTRIIWKMFYNMCHNFFNFIFQISTRIRYTVASKRFWSSMSFQNWVRLSQIKKISLPDYAHVNKMSKN
jgi:hypothetical protein